MKTTLTTSQAANILIDDEYAKWSRAGAFAIVEHLAEMEEDCGEEIEFDAVAIRCDFSEYDSLVDWARDYFGGDQWKCELDIDQDDMDDEIDDAIRDYIRDYGQLIEFDGGIIVSSF